MSIPERLWRVVRGYWELADDRLEDAQARLAEAAAYQELADTLRQAPPPSVSAAPGQTPVLPEPAPAAEGHRDPLEAAYALLRLEPGADLVALESAYQARLAEIRPDRFAPGTAERSALDGKRAAVDAAYEKLRDALNLTETRFEHLEF